MKCSSLVLGEYFVITFCEKSLKVLKSLCTVKKNLCYIYELYIHMYDLAMVLAYMFFFLKCKYFTQCSPNDDIFLYISVHPLSLSLCQCSCRPPSW